MVTLRLSNKTNANFSGKFARDSLNFMKVRPAVSFVIFVVAAYVVLSFVSSPAFRLSSIEYWGQVSQDAKNLISSLLTVDPNRRKTASKSMEAKWMSAGDDYLMSQDLGLNLKEFKKFNAKRKFRAAVGAIVAAQKMSSLGMDFKKNLG